MEAEARRLIVEGLAKPTPKHAAAGAVAAVAAKTPAKGVKRKVAGDLLTAKERGALKPDAQAALRRLREMFADRKGEEKGSRVKSFLAERRGIWGEE